MRQKLTGDTRTSILTIKGAYWQRPEFRDTVTSDLIYRAVLENGVRTVSDFERFIMKTLSSSREACPLSFQRP